MNPRAVALFVAARDTDPEHHAGAADPTASAFLSTLDRVRAVPVSTSARAGTRSDKTLAKLRGYGCHDLAAVATLAQHYLRSGHLDVARVLFEGLTAIDPADGRCALALALTYDRLGRAKNADQWYRRAAELDPGEPRADIDRAELLLSVDRADAARTLLVRGIAKASARGEPALTRKAEAILRHLDANHHRPSGAVR